MLSEQDEDWSTKRYFQESSILKAYTKQIALPEPVDMEVIAKKASTIIEIAKDEDIAIGKRAA